MRRHLAGRERIFASNLLEAELRAALAREEVPWSAALVEPIDWILPSRPLGEEIARALGAGYLRGADLWHVACALYLTGAIGSPVEFLTLDARQQSVAATLGLGVPDV